MDRHHRGRQRATAARLHDQIRAARDDLGVRAVADERERLALHLDDVLVALREGRPLPAPPSHPSPAVTITA